MMAHPLDAQIRAMLPPNIANKMPPVNSEVITEKQMAPTPEYLAQLLKDKNALPMVPNMFIHVERVLDEEIARVRKALYSVTSENKPLVLPEAQGPVVQLSEKLYVPVKTYPDFNFVGRILGPRGMTAKQLEKDTGCKIMVRGKGSMRDKKKEEQNRGKPNWEHLNEELHVLITVEDSQDRAKAKIARAVEEIKKLLVPTADGEDELKKRQLMELAIMNGTYRDNSKPQQNHIVTPLMTEEQNMRMVSELGRVMNQTSPRAMAPPGALIPQPLRSPTPAHPGLAGMTPAFIPRMTSAGQALLANGAHPPPMMPTADATSIIYAPYAAAGEHYPYAITPTLLEYPPVSTDGAIGAVPKVRRTVREHPYQRAVLDARAATGN